MHEEGLDTPVLFGIDFDDFTSSVYSQVLVSIDKIYQTLKTVFHRSAIQTTRISSKILCCVSYFQLSSRCLDILMKHCFSCLIYNMNIIWSWYV